jgi:hypothetical protein
VKASDYDRSRFLRGTDLTVEKKIKIRDVTGETVGRNKEDKLIVWFTNDKRGLPLNKTNNRVIKTAFGDETDGWTNKIIVIYPTMAEFQSKTVPCLRVKLPAPKLDGAAAAQPAPVPKPAPPTADPDLNDDPTMPPLEDEIDDEINF